MTNRGKLFFLYASPLNCEALDVRAELSLLQAALQQGKSTSSGERKPFEVEVDVRLGTAHTLLELLSHGDSDHGGCPIFLHCAMHAGVSASDPSAAGGSAGATLALPEAGHGTSMQSFLLLEDEAGCSQVLPRPRLLGWLRRVCIGRRCPISAVFLNSCDSEGIAEAFVEVGVPHVVCCRGKVFDSACRTFTRAFYRSLASGRSVLQAFEYGTESVACAPQAGLRAEAEKFLLLPRQEDLRRFPSLNVGSISRHLSTTLRDLTACPGLVEDTSHGTNDAGMAVRWMAPVGGPDSSRCVLPLRSQHFLGRTGELMEMAQHLARGGERGVRIVNIWGKTPGLGKSALLAEFIRFFVCPGRLFAGAAVWVSLGNPSDDLPNPAAAAKAAAAAGGGYAGARPAPQPPPQPASRLERALSGQEAKGALFLSLVLSAVEAFLEAFGKELEPPGAGLETREDLLRALRLLEREGRVLLVLDGIDSWVDSREVRAILAELLQGTERLCLLFGSRIHVQTSFGGLKTDNLELKPLKPRDAAQLFLYRVHRHIYWKDLWRTRDEWMANAAALYGASAFAKVADRTQLERGEVPIALDRVSRSHFLDALASMPLLAEFCQGVPERIRQTAERVTSSCRCLWDLLESLRAERDRGRRSIQDRILRSPTVDQFQSRPAAQRRLRTAGAWQVGKVLGQGAHGVVHHALDLSSGESFAVKVTEDAPELHQELEMYQQLDHEHVVCYLGHEVHDKQLYIFLEYMPEGTLRDKLSEFGAFSERLCGALSRQILSGLEYLHEQDVIHRDLKCSNLLLDVSGRVKISDFGCSRWIAKGGQAKTLAGSPLWLAPELLSGDEYDQSADIWSFGCTMLELLTAHPPWRDQICAENGVAAAIQIQQRTARGETPSVAVEIRAALTEECQSFIWEGCLRVRPSQRHRASKLLLSRWLLPRGSSKGRGTSSAAAAAEPPD